MVWGIVVILIFVLVLLVWSLPLFITVKLLGGKTSLLKALGVNILIGILAFAVSTFLNFWAGIVIFILTLLVYRKFFRLKWWKAIVVWLLQGVVAIILVLLFVALGLGALLL
jgi:hypothetical protein